MKLENKAREVLKEMKMLQALLQIPGNSSNLVDYIHDTIRELKVEFPEILDRIDDEETVKELKIEAGLK